LKFHQCGQSKAPVKRTGVRFWCFLCCTGGRQNGRNDSVRPRRRQMQCRLVRPGHAPVAGAHALARHPNHPSRRGGMPLRAQSSAAAEQGHPPRDSVRHRRAPPRAAPLLHLPCAGGGAEGGGARQEAPAARQRETGEGERGKPEKGRSPTSPPRASTTTTMLCPRRPRQPPVAAPDPPAAALLRSARSAVGWWGRGGGCPDDLGSHPPPHP
jgi:hypothetical protein